jgi:phosphatidylinositol alpha-1,6-mannosyltransferase
MLESIAIGLTERNFKVEVLTFGEPMYAGCEDFDSRQPYIIHRTAAESQRSSSIIGMGLALLRLIGTRRFDVILCGVAWSSGVLALLARTLLKVPFVIYTHGEDTSIVFGSRYKTFLLKTAFDRCSALLTNSSYSKNLVGQISPINRCEVLYPTIDPSPYLEIEKSRIDGIRAKYGLGGARLILTVARLQSRKGHDTVIRSLPLLVPKFDDILYVIVGAGDQTILKTLASDLNVADRVVFVSGLAESDLIALYGAASLYVMVSRWDSVSQEVEGFGMTYLEAAAAGKASIGGKHGGVADAIVDTKTGLLVDPESFQETAFAIDTLLSDESKATEMGLAGRSRVLIEFTNLHFVDRIEDALRQAVGT